MSLPVGSHQVIKLPTFGIIKYFHRLLQVWCVKLLTELGLTQKRGPNSPQIEGRRGGESCTACCHSKRSYKVKSDARCRNKLYLYSISGTFPFTSKQRSLIETIPMDQILPPPYGIHSESCNKISQNKRYYCFLDLSKYYNKINSLRFVTIFRLSTKMAGMQSTNTLTRYSTQNKITNYRKS